LGRGARPTDDIPTKVIVIEHDSMGAHHIAEKFRLARPSIVGRVSADRFILDARTIFDPLDLVPRWANQADATVRPA
jgi:hypothetical protein